MRKPKRQLPFIPGTGTTICDGCFWMTRDQESRPRCYSPQLVQAGMPGIPVQFERDEHAEPDRSHEAGTGKCGPMKLNFRQRESA